ncbi:MAG: hypothetical protein RML94_05970 [Bacteroidia bacterium]|nr:hypothetical protein [Bacteroidia bacterium]
MGVSLWAFRCAHAHKVGVLRADGATLRYAPSLTACPSHASRRKNTLNTFIQSLIFYMPHNQIKTR